MFSIGRPCASMRPRVFPAEDTEIAVPKAEAEARRFNEAAGIPRGRPPRQTTSHEAGGNGFNEAAGIPRGRQDCRSSPLPGASSFNEAAGIPRGRRCSRPRATVRSSPLQ